MGSRGRLVGKSRGVTPFPPIPKLPKAPQFPADPRQSSSAHVLGAIGGIARGTMRVSGPNLSTGFHASAVELGRLQSVPLSGLGERFLREAEAVFARIDKRPLTGAP